MKGLIDRPWFRWTALAMASLSVPAIAGAIFGLPLRDDAYITIGAARELVERGAILNINHQHTEQSSSLTMVLLIALASFVSRWPVQYLATPISLIASALAPLALFIFARESRGRVAFVAVLLFVTFPSFHYWAGSGMETTLAAVLLVCATFVGSRCLAGDRLTVFRMLVRGGILLACEGSRPELPLVLSIAAGLCLLVTFFGFAPYASRRGAVLFASSAVLSAVVLAAGRWLFYRRLFPLPVYAKTASLLTGVAQGASYVGQSIAYAPFLLLVAVAGATTAVLIFKKRDDGSSPESRSRLLAATSVVVVGLCFVIVSGGDWMGKQRLFIPMLPLGCYVLATSIQKRMRPPWTYSAVLVALLMNAWSLRGHMVGRGSAIEKRLLKTANAHPERAKTWCTEEICSDVPAYSLHRDITFFDQAIPLLAAIPSKGSPLRVASVQAGLGFFLITARFGSKVEVIDMHGLVTEHIYRCPNLTHDVFGASAPDPVACFDHPDVVFGLYSPPDDLRRAGYTLVLDTGVGDGAGREWMMVREP